MNMHRAGSRPSIPPDSEPSPVPSPPVSPPPSVSGFRSGWRPADGDNSQEAVAWRAAAALRRADRALSAIDDLRTSVDKLEITIGASTAKAEKVLRALGRLFWALAVATTLGAGTLVWQWISTLHH